MSRSANFSNDLCNELRQRIPSHCWSTEWKPVKGSRESVDVVGFPKPGDQSKHTILIEVELRRGDPASNIIKIWQWIEQRDLPDSSTRDGENTTPKKLVLFQGFSKVYRLVKRPNMTKKARDARFVGTLFQSLNRGVSYIPLSFEYHPYKGAHEGGGARKRAARRLSKKILAKWRKIRRAKRGTEKKSR